MTLLVKLHFGRNIFAVVVDTNSRLDWLGPFKGALDLKFIKSYSVLRTKLARSVGQEFLFK